MPAIKIRITDGDIHLINLRTRMPFKYGIATMTHMPQAFVRLRVEVDGKPSAGIAADLLPPKWFTKDPAKPVAEEIMEMLRVIQKALSLAVGLSGTTAFDLWQQLYEEQNRWGAGEKLPPLLTNFGVSLVERALIEAVCRAAGRPFAQMLRGGQLGLRLGEVHAALREFCPADFLPTKPLSEIVLRHTVGLSDSLTDADIPAAERLDDGLPQSLSACIQHYGLRHFKIKVSGNRDGDIERLRRVAEILKGHAPPDFAFSLDGNEQFKSFSDFRSFWETLTDRDELKKFFQHLLFVEQPLHRDVALRTEVEEHFGRWPNCPPMIIDESDATLESLPTALDLGYVGTSHKNCKGVFKGVANRCLLLHEQRRRPEHHRIMSGEDLCNIGPIALLQDLAVMAALGIQSVERNGQHYVAGLSLFPKSVQQQALASHVDLYQESPAGWPTLRINRGLVQIASLNEHSLGVGFVLDVVQFTPVQQWGGGAGGPNLQQHLNGNPSVTAGE